MGKLKSVKRKCDFDCHLRLSSDDYDFLSSYAIKNGTTPSKLIRSLIKSFVIKKKGELSDENFQTYLND